MGERRPQERWGKEPEGESGAAASAVSPEYIHHLLSSPYKEDDWAGRKEGAPVAPDGSLAFRRLDFGSLVGNHQCGYIRIDITLGDDRSQCISSGLILGHPSRPLLGNKYKYL